MIHGITYTDENMTKSAELCRSSMLKHGFDTCHIFDDNDISYEFKLANKDIHIIDRMDEDIFFFGNNWNHVDWCKMDVIMAINRGDVSILAKQVQASVIFFRNTQKVRDFVKEWLLYCQMPNFIDDSPSKLLNVFTFQEHRHDQAILTSLQIKHGYKLHWWPASYSDGQFAYDKIEQYQNDNYPVIFNHHRKRNDE